jgi:hypothetical protein
VHLEHEQFSVAEMLEDERAKLRPMTTPFDGYVERAASVSSTCLVRRRAAGTRFGAKRLARCSARSFYTTDIVVV